MTRFSTAYGLSKVQAELDFVDVNLDGDLRLFLCPYAIQIRDDEWSDKCGDHIRSFFGEVLDQLRAGNHERVVHLLSHLHEPNETRLGVSKGRPRGRGIGDDKAGQLADALQGSRAFITGLLSDIAEAELFVSGIGRDTVSDLTTNILRGPLAEYTAAQCELYGVPTIEVGTLGPIWNPVSRDWESRALRLPVFDGKPILLVPKFSVRRRLSLESKEFYDHHMIEYLREEYQDAANALVQALRKPPRITKKSVKEKHPLIKDDLASFVRDHPEVLERYKKMSGSAGPLTPGEIDEGFDEAVFAQVLIEKLREIPPGSEEARRYHNLVTGIATFLFHPSLITPIKESEQHEGRKRIDIKFSNSADGGFFHRVLVAPQTRAISVFLECKNYSQEHEMGNREFDQLAGRFGHQRGFFGMLLCRSVEERQRVTASCRDAAGDGRGFMLVLDDNDLIQLLQFVVEGHRERIDQFLGRRFDEISS